MKQQISGLYSSRPQSGKSEVARVLTDRCGFWTVKFAGPLKDMTRGLLRSMGFDKPTVEQMVEGDLKEAVVPGFATITPRHLMQTLGTDWGREAVDNDLWTKVAMSKVRYFLRLGASVVIDDLRFPNEHAALLDIGATLVRINRPGESNLVGSPRYEGRLDDHYFDHVIENDGTLDELREKAERIADDYYGARL